MITPDHLAYTPDHELNHLNFLVAVCAWVYVLVFFFVFFCFDLILYVPSTIFQLYRDGLPGLNQY